MDEGKPTRAKWWSRPRPQSSRTPEGDFELAEPAPRGRHNTADTPTGPAINDADPDPGPGPNLDTGDADTYVPSGDGDVGTHHVPSGDGDYELSRPTTTHMPQADPTDPANQAAPAAPAVPVASADPAVPAVGGAVGVGAVSPGGRADVGFSGEAGSAGPSLGSVEEGRPKPLHDPDPYSTPPYGEPGPWAPAPPVLHPAATMPPPSTHADAAPPLGPAAEAGPGLGPLSASTPPTAPTPWGRYDPWSPTPFAGAPLPGTDAARATPPGAPLGGSLQHAGVHVLSAAERRRQMRWRLVGGALAVALVSGGLGGAVGAYLERNGGLNGVQLPQASAQPTGRAADSVAGIAARALPSVVTLHVSGGDESDTGTGFVLDSLGYILTNNHVVEPAGSNGEITVVFNGGTTAKAEVVGRDSGYDLAVVRVTGVKGLKPLYLGNSDNVQVGDPVVAIGAPFDLEGTVTSGIISAKERPITAGGGNGSGSGDGSDVSYVDALQTDAPINPGNSGGPLLDRQGHVIGINSAIRSAADGTDSGTAQAGSIGLGFAIPINQGKRVAEELINTGKATHPVIGITLDLDYAGDGARVGTAGVDGGAPVTAGGPGDRAGIRAGDVITEVDGQRVHSGEELIVKTRAHRPGDRLELTVERGGAQRTLTLVLGSSGAS
ncbi:trypsin-like peptidase domain-containing protein [Streptomyces sp. 3214.6]|uniref:trypsin-like peptidase domain-containing protein n=1 Tax=Streptomyces sp. 3214.6 TaxID=1882757 RepID=UPI00090BA449|nr:trypsin-like peptidase domain-containing protein [Streptomyces sp. 3214.6]SHH99101.1 putative serine protease PepD [Streptomyces sp. 3214.6]